MKAKSSKFIAIGRHKTSVARVVLVPGMGKVMMNKQNIDRFCYDAVTLQILREPLVTTNTAKKTDIFISVTGGGFRGQIKAARLGIARAIIKMAPKYRTVLKGNGFLTRDARVKERKKIGLLKARKAKQYSKR